jgi:glucosyltransferase
MEMLALVVPCYNEEKTIPIFYETVEKIKKQIPAQIAFYFVDDGSRDRTLAILRTFSQKDSAVHYISFSRNFGKEAALYAGLHAAKGDYIATMDVDLQDPPSLLPEMWAILHDSASEYDCVATRRTTRTGEPPIRSFFARLFYKLINKLSDTEIVDGARDYRLMTRQMVDAIVADAEYNRFSKGIFSWVGFKTKWISFKNVERSAGETKWSFWKLFKYSIEGILAYTTVPLYMSSILGFIMCGFSFLALAFIIVRALLFGDPVAGWPSLVSIITFLGGLILLCMGVMGLYIAKIYLETKHRQIYIVREKR